MDFLAILYAICLMLLGVGLYRRFARGVIILLYHRIEEVKKGKHEDVYVSPKVFEMHMRYFCRKGYTFLSEKDLMKFLFENVPLPGKSVMLTFDDGYLDNFTTALPILERYGARATIFLTTAFIGKRIRWDGAECLTLNQIKEMEVLGTDFGSHTNSHPSLIRSSEEQMKEEIVSSRKVLEGLLGHEVSLFSYPFGHYSRAAKDLVKAAGYKAAFTLHKGINLKSVDPYALRRLRPSRFLKGFILQLLSSPVIECLRTYQRSRSPHA